MINIRKTNEPTDLLNEKIRIRRELGREVTANDYDNFRKDNLNELLLREQGGLCCYCMCRINSDNMQVEHFLPKGNPEYAARALDYDNLLATCNGGKKKGEKNNKSLYHCDTKKADALLDVLPNPADESRDYAEIITYGADGKVKGVTTI